MQGIGNDYVYINCFKERVVKPEKLAVAMSDRHFGVGSDGLILIMPSDRAGVRMRMFNADGSEAQMCGNGIRCVAKYAYDHGLVKNKTITVETLAGVKTLKLVTQGGKVSKVTVDMGEPRLRRSQIPMQSLVNPRKGKARIEADEDQEDIAVNEKLSVDSDSFDITCVNVGNPHCMIFVKDVAGIRLAELGPKIENHPAFPDRINVHFVQVKGSAEVTMRTWERGSGITLACGTGATAVCVAGAVTGRTGRRIVAHLPGGDLDLEWASDNHVYMTGPAVEVFSGEWNG
jgi:diaminopimelate epimerase